jgi:hypothetical protein
MDTVKEHAITVDVKRVDEKVFMTIKIKGKLQHSDYEMMNSALDNAISSIEEPKIKVLIDALEFDGWEPRAAWDDLKFGLKYSKEFTKLAFVGNRSWEEYAIKITDWFMSTEMHYFETIDEAMEWLKT